MDGLECSEIRLSCLERTARIDAEFYKKENLYIDAELKKTDFHPITDYFSVSDGNHMSISDNFCSEGIPYYRGQDIYHVFIEEASPICINKKTYEHPHMYRSHLKAGDVLMSIVGAIIGNSAIVSTDNDATCSCKLSILRSKNTGIIPEALLVYIKSLYGQNQIQKFKRGAAQTGLLLEDFDQLLIPKFGEEFQQAVKKIVDLSHEFVLAASEIYRDAEKTLGDTIWDDASEPESLSSSIKNYSDSFLVSGRLDAEYYQPKYEALFGALSKFKTQKLGGARGLVNVAKSIEPGSEAYVEVGIPFVRVSDVSKFEISEPEIKLRSDILPNPEVLFPQKDTILLSKDGSVGIAYKIESTMPVITSGALLHLTVRNKAEVLPDYLALVLNSPIVQLQAERDSNGAIIQHWKPSEIENVIIPVLDMDVQKEIATKVQESFALRKQSKHLLKYAKQAVEMAIKQGEDVALEWLIINGGIM